MSNKRLLLITGPQGSGNHLWAKVLNSHSSVSGWDFKGEYWDGHHNEPFNMYFSEPEKLKADDISEYSVASVSTPYVRNKRNNLPKLKQFIERCTSLGVDVTVALIGRDVNILSMQQVRLRGGETFHLHLENVESLPIAPKAFLSIELLNLYKDMYLQHVSDILDWPIDMEIAKKEIVNENEKYIKYVDEVKLDNIVKRHLAES